MNTRHHRRASGLMGIVLALLVAVPALAHADLVSSTPEDGAVLVVPPTAVELGFSEGLNAGKSSFKLIGPDGDVGTGVARKDGATSMVLGDLELAPGEYRIKWAAAADDGHIERGTLRFTVTAPTPEPATPSPPPTTTPSAGPEATLSTAPATEPPTAPSPTASAMTDTPAVSPAPSAGEPASAAGTEVVVPIMAGLVLVALVGVLVLRRSRRA